MCQCAAATGRLPTWAGALARMVGWSLCRGDALVGRAFLGEALSVEYLRRMSLAFAAAESSCSSSACCWASKVSTDRTIRCHAGDGWLSPRAGRCPRWLLGLDREGESDRWTETRRPCFYIVGDSSTRTARHRQEDLCTVQLVTVHIGILHVL